MSGPKVWRGVGCFAVFMELLRVGVFVLSAVILCLGLVALFLDLAAAAFCVPVVPGGGVEFFRLSDDEGGDYQGEGGGYWFYHAQPVFHALDEGEDGGGDDDDGQGNDDDDWFYQ